MEQTISFQSILIISLLAFITPIIVSSFRRIKIPFIVGEILVGIIVGKSFFNIVQDDIWIVFLSNLGLAYLMFLSGLEVEVEDLKVSDENNKGFKNLILCFSMFLISLVISFLISKFLVSINLIKNVTFFTFLFASSAPGFIVPFLKDKDLLNTGYGQIILIFNLIAEFICLIGITIISSIALRGFSYKNFLFIIVIFVSFLLYIIIRKLFKYFDFSIAAFRNLHIEVRAAFALILLLVTLSQVVHSEIVLGSFLAGLIFSFLFQREREDLKYKLDIIGYGFLIPIFFISVGVNLDISSMFQNPKTLLMIPVLLLIFYLIKFIPSLLLSKYFGIKKAIASSFILSTQLSLVIVGSQIAYSLNLIDSSAYSLFIITTIISCLLFPVIFDKTFNYDDIEKKKKPLIDKVCIRETIVTNEQVFNKPLKEIPFPKNCIVFLLIRDELEIVPNGNTILLQGDILILAGMQEQEEEMLSIVNMYT